MPIKSFALAAAAALAVSGPAAVLAQDDFQDPPGIGPGPDAPPAEYTDDQVNAFVDAIEAAAKVDEAWRPRIAAAADEVEAQELTLQSQDER